MLRFSRHATAVLRDGSREIRSFLGGDSSHLDLKTVAAFGAEWSRFRVFSDAEIQQLGESYFDLVDDAILSRPALVLDVGCGSGRFTKYVSARAGFVEAIDPSLSVLTASEFLNGVDNVRVSQADTETIPFPDEAFDFVMCLGVLHHVPDTAKGLAACAAKLKRGGHFLLYLYYNLDNRSLPYRALYEAVNLCRIVICRLPAPLKRLACDAIAAGVYLPLAAISRMLWKSRSTRRAAERMPLAFYRDKSFRIMRNDALDRFGTPLERRFSRSQMRRLMENAGLTDIRFSPKEPYWHALGRKA